MAVAESRSQLLIRKRDLYAALRTLEQDYQDGSIDTESYRLTRARYEQEAAHILALLDDLPAEQKQVRTHDQDDRVSPRTYRILIAAAGVALAVAVVIFLLAAAHQGNSQPVAQPTTTNLAVRAAQENAQQHPHNPQAWIDLGNAQEQAGMTAAADRSYVHAMQLAPNQAQPATLHAMMLSATQHDAAALHLLKQVERAHPTYARAWLLDGIVSARKKSGYPRAIAAWQRFLQLDPRNSLAAQVRVWIANARKAEQKP